MTYGEPTEQGPTRGEQQLPVDAERNWAEVRAEFELEATIGAPAVGETTEIYALMDVDPNHLSSCTLPGCRVEEGEYPGVYTYTVGESDAASKKEPNTQELWDSIIGGFSDSPIGNRRTNRL